VYEDLKIVAYIAPDAYKEVLLTKENVEDEVTDFGETAVYSKVHWYGKNEYTTMAMDFDRSTEKTTLYGLSKALKIFASPWDFTVWCGERTYQRMNFTNRYVRLIPDGDWPVGIPTDFSAIGPEHINWCLKTPYASPSGDCFYDAGYIFLFETETKQRVKMKVCSFKRSKDTYWRIEKSEIKYVVYRSKTPPKPKTPPEDPFTR